jgi:hypothetical protein
MFVAIAALGGLSASLCANVRRPQPDRRQIGNQVAKGLRRLDRAAFSAEISARRLMIS